MSSTSDMPSARTGLVNYEPLRATDIKFFRSEMGWTQEQLAIMCGQSVHTIAKWERTNSGTDGHWRLHFAALKAGLMPWPMPQFHKLYSDVEGKEYRLVDKT